MENQQNATVDIAESEKKAHVSSGSRGQRAFALAVAIGTAAYLALAVSGTIKPTNRLTSAEFATVLMAALIVGVLWRPDIIDRLQKIDIAGIKLDLGEVKERQIEVQKHQQEQRRALDDLRFAMRILIKQPERQHLLNLYRHETNYKVKGALKEELRRLRAMGLIEMCGNKTVGGIPERTEFDLAEFVKLTRDGKEYVERFSDQADPQAKEASAAG